VGDTAGLATAFFFSTRGVRIERFALRSFRETRVPAEGRSRASVRFRDELVAEDDQVLRRLAWGGRETTIAFAHHRCNVP
jgi:hypothetical protein